MLLNQPEPHGCFHAAATCFEKHCDFSSIEDQISRIMPKRPCRQFLNDHKFYWGYFQVKIFLMISTVLMVDQVHVDGSTMYCFRGFFCIVSMETTKTRYTEKFKICSTFFSFLNWAENSSTPSRQLKIKLLLLYNQIIILPEYMI